MILPNALTVSRIFLTLLFISLIVRDGFFFKFSGSMVFLVASLTDYYDGYYAKKHNMITDFGKLLDPIADKFLVLAAFFVFSTLDIISIWYFIVILFREVAITTIRLIAVRSGDVLSAEKLGKYKTVTQMVAIGFILLFMMISESIIAKNWSDVTFAGWNLAIDLMMWIAITLTLVSGISFVWNNRKIFTT